MKRLKISFTLILCLFFSIVTAQNSNNCEHCNMKIGDKSHNASAKNATKTMEFDAIECLINYLKVNSEADFSALQVSDYKTGTLTNAKVAIYLKSKAIASPMGANLSAFKNRNEALKIKEEKGGELYTWEEIKAKFKDSRFGAVDHSHHDHYRPDAHAPIGVMGDHLHAKGGLMVSFRYMNMAMDGNKSGTDAISDSDIYNSFMVAPQDMTMKMYMLGIMYAPTNKLTLMAMQSYARRDMDLTARMMMMPEMFMLRDFSTSSSGLGDLKINGMYGLFNNHKQSLHLNTGVSLPVGDIKNRDNTPMRDDVKLPYAMQLGSGTFDLIIGATYKENYTNVSWGAQTLNTIRTGKSSEDYRFGNAYQLNIWGAYKVSSNFSVSLRMLGVSEDDLNGMDPELMPMMVTTTNTVNYGSDKLKAFVGVNLAFPQTSSLKDFRLGIEAGAPIYEDYNGIQMNENLNINFGVKYNIL